MSEPIGILADILAAIVVMFIAPAIILGNMAERVADMYVSRETDRFNEVVCEMGYLDSEMYEAFMTKINAVGQAMHMDINCSTNVWEPVYENGIFTGDAICYERRSGTEEVLDIMYEKGSYRLRRNDTVEITVSNRKGSLAFVTGCVRGRQTR